MMSSRQRGDGYPVFIGSSYQRGRGFGSIMASLFRNVIVPTAKKYAVPVLKSVVKTGARRTANVLSNVASGRGIKEAFIDEFNPSTTQQGSGNRKRKRIARTSRKTPPGKRLKKTKNVKRGEKNTNKDIWSGISRGRTV